MVEYGFATQGQEIVSAFADQVKGKTFAITGPSEGGIGAEIAITLAKASPARLILFGRSREKTQSVIDSIAAASEQSSPVETDFIQVELASLASVRKAAQEVLSNTAITQIDGIVNNAGVMALPTYETTPEGYEKHLVTNYLSHFLLTNLLMPKLLASPSPRVVNLSSYGHRMSPFRFDDPQWSNGATYHPTYAYAQSKTANILFSVALNERLGTTHHLRSYAVDPGSVATSLTRHITPDQFKEGLELFAKHGIVRPERKTPAQGCAGPLRALLQPDISNEDGVYITDTKLTTDPAVVKTYATDREEARRLWELSEEWVGQKFTY
ncbi:hypothetical protein VTN96DRAFT_13 [Rasamsonia emersonii]